MKINTRYTIKNILFTVLWCLVGAGCIMLLVAAVHKKDAKKCMGVEISISGVSTNFFIDKHDVERIISAYGGKDAVGKSLADFNLGRMEAALKKDEWIQDAKLFFDNNDILQAQIEEREPVARVFTSGGSTFYIDSSNMMLPLSEKFSARLPVFTNFPSEAKILSKADSSLLNDIKTISTLIRTDSFLMAMIDQVDITAQRNFEMIPKIGNQVIVFGDATDAAAKFKKLLLFYKKVMMQMGWNRYKTISLQYKNQVVAKIRGAEDVIADSLRTKQLIELIAENAAKNAEDSTIRILQEERRSNDSSMIQQMLQRDEDTGEFTGADEMPVPKPAGNKVADEKVMPKSKAALPHGKPQAKPNPVATVVKKAPAVKQKEPGKLPKVTMPKKN